MASVFPEPSANRVPRLTPAGSIVDWLMSSEQDCARQSRRLLNTWLEPLGQDATLLQAIVGDNRAFRAAFHELYLAASLRQAQHSHQLEPATRAGPDTTPLPAATDDGSALEIVDTGCTRRDAGPGRRLSTLLREVENFDTPPFKVMVTADTIGPLPAVVAPLRQEITRWVATLSAGDSVGSTGHHRYRHNGWSLTLEAIRIDPRWWAVPARTTSSETAYAHQREDQRSLRQALEAATATNHRAGPHLLAVQERTFSPGPDHDRHQLMAWHRTNALFGTAGTIAARSGISSDLRLPDGFWRPHSPAHQQVSAVLLTDHLAPWNALLASPELWLNPASTDPGVTGLPLWRHIQFRWTEGAAPEVHRITASTTTAAQFWASHDG